MEYSILIDIGNSALKLALANPAGILRKWSFPHESSIREELAAIALTCPSKPGAILLASVAPKRTEKLLPLIAKLFGPRIAAAGRDIPIPLENRYKNPDRLGVDRLLAAYAAINLRPRHNNIIVVDIGTAITFDCISQNAYLGGLLFPGPGISAKALAAYTGQLPEVDIIPQVELPPQGEMPAPATDTISGIRNGLFFGYASLIEGLCGKLKLAMPKPAWVIASGGYAERLKKACPVLNEIIPDLVMAGLWQLYYNSRLSKKSIGLPAN